MLILVGILVIIFLASCVGGNGKYYYGRKPTKKEVNDNKHWIADFIQQHKYDGFKQYPDCHERANLINDYIQLEKDFTNGKIDYIDYENSLKKITDQIDIKDVI